MKKCLIKIAIILPLVLLSGCGDDEGDLYNTQTAAYETAKEEAGDNEDKSDSEDIGRMIEKPEKVLFTKEDTDKIEADVLEILGKVRDLYVNPAAGSAPGSDSSAASTSDTASDTASDSSVASQSSYEGFLTIQKREEIVKVLAGEGVPVSSADINTQNGEQLEKFYENYKADSPGQVTVYNVENDGKISVLTFMYKDGALQSYYLSAGFDEKGEPVLSKGFAEDIESVILSGKGYFFYKYSNILEHEGLCRYIRVKPLSDKCRELTRKYLGWFDPLKYNLFTTDWNEDNVADVLMPGLFQDLYYAKYQKWYGDDIAGVPGELFETVMTTYLPVDVSILRKAYSYDEGAQTYFAEEAVSQPYPPFLEVTDYEENQDGTITLYADGVWPDFMMDKAFSDTIVLMPGPDGDFKFLSNKYSGENLVSGADLLQGADGVNRSGSSDNDGVIAELGKQGYVAVDYDNRVNMTNYDKLLAFIDAAKSGKDASVTVMRLANDGGMSQYDFESKNGKITIGRSQYAFDGKQMNLTMSAKYEPEIFEYTPEGYLIFEGHWDSEQMYVLALSEEEEHVALRVEPMDDKLRELTKKYLYPVSYGRNNIFISNWSEEDWSAIDFYDVFELFYEKFYNKKMPYTAGADMSVGSEYKVSAKEFEDVITAYFPVKADTLRSLLRYDEAGGCYIFRPRGYGESDYCDIPYPEVSGYTEENDIITLEVNAVFPTDNTSKLFTHEVKLRDDNGKITFLSNRADIPDDSLLWWHSKRMTDKEWEGTYGGN